MNDKFADMSNEELIKLAFNLRNKQEPNYREQIKNIIDFLHKERDFWLCIRF